MVKKLPQPILHKVIFQANYKPELNFYNLLYPAAMQFSNYEHWETSGLYVFLYDYLRRCTLAIRHSSFSYEWDYGGTKSYIADIREAMDLLPSSLQISSFTRLGLRQHILIATDMDFTEISNVLNVKFLSQNEQLLSLFPNGVGDMTYSAIGADGPLTLHLTVGPLRRAEISNHIQINQKHHFAPNRPEDYAAVFSSYPDVAVFVDLDIYQSDEAIKPVCALEFIDKAQILAKEKIAILCDYIFASKVEP